MKRLLIFLFFISSNSFSQDNSFSKDNLISLYGSTNYEAVYTGVRYQKDIGSRGSVSIGYLLVVMNIKTARNPYTNDLIELSYNYYLKPKGDYVSSQGFYISPSILLSADFIRNRKNMDFEYNGYGNNVDFRHIKFGIGPKIGYQWVFNNINLGIDMPWYYMVSEIKETYLFNDNLGNTFPSRHWSYNSNGIGYYINLSIGYVF